ncbi:MAG: hypothetical protein PHQ60_15740 [Sideroxydans sp.]|nr:hypothetical protein [Sideroxydans sp.]
MTVTEVIRAIKPFVLSWMSLGISLIERTAPGTPPADSVILYAKDDAGTTKLYYKDSAGTEKEIATL